jgi:membrane-bound lytic murein transglycosylase D
VAGIRILLGSEVAEREFTGTVRIGRDPGCDLRINDQGVSRVHAEIFRAGGRWFVRDLGSSNGTFLDGERVQEVPLPERCKLRLGTKGPEFVLNHDGQAQSDTAIGNAEPLRSLDEIAAHYFDADSKTPAGDRTMMVRRAFSTVKRRQTRRYRSAIAAVLGLLLVAVGVGIYQYSQLQRTRGLAEQLFYNMKTMELQLTRLETQVEASGDGTLAQEADAARAQLVEMTNQYDAFLEELGVAEDKLSPEDRLIFRMARVFGECELAMPKGFVTEVKRYIDVWRADERLVNALQQAREQELVPVITRSMLEQHLPPQFFYVALQESDLRPDAVGPTTRFGIAKGLWQLMPATASQYGLQTGPLLELPRFDPADQRFDPPAATRAAARYLGDLYRGEAQASGLLVLASYNWGPTRVKKRIRAMNENPRDRNFWALLAQGDIPKETRDYVFLIFAAAVIGEDPGLFGFEFEKPLSDFGKIPART